LILEALRVRREIEQIAARLGHATTGIDLHEVWSSNVASRLFLTLAQEPQESFGIRIRVLQKVVHVYVETSDVLHARRRVSHLSLARVFEWDAGLLRLQELIRQLPEQHT
jgi:hypothetical protein